MNINWIRLLVRKRIEEAIINAEKALNREG